MKYMKIAGTMIAACLMSGQSFANDEVPSYVKINSIAAAGTGCPLGTIAKNVSSDKKAFTMTFSDYIAEVYDGSLPADSRRNCTLTVDLDFPEGWSYSVVNFDYRGYVYLDEKVNAIAKAQYYFQSQEQNAEFVSRLTGETDRDYHFRDSLGLDAVIWSPDCDGASRPLNLQTQIRVNNNRNKNGEGFITVDSIDGEFSQSYGLVWKKCPTKPEQPVDDWRPDYDDRFPTAPANVTISDLTYNGSGCPLGTIAETISGDKKAFTLAVDSFIAEAGPGISIRESRKNCQVTMSLDYPSEWTFAIATFDYRGYMYLDNRVEASQGARYYFQGQPNSIDISETKKGLADEDYHFRHIVPVDALNWAPCGAKRALNINTDIRVNNRRARSKEGFITVDSQDGEFKAYHALVWRKC